MIPVFSAANTSHSTHVWHCLLRVDGVTLGWGWV